MATQESLDLAQQMYVSYYGRPADPAGLEFWAKKFDESSDLTAALTEFGNSEEYTTNFGSLSNEELVNNLYHQMFSRDAEAEGLEWYVGLLKDGTETLSSIAYTIGGASLTEGNDDGVVFGNKIKVANTYTDAVESMDATYGDDEVADAKGILDDVDGTEASVVAGNAAAEAEVADNVPVDPGTPGDTFTLTDGRDAFTGTENNDKFFGDVGQNQNGAISNALSTGDRLDGKGGHDVLTATMINDNEVDGTGAGTTFQAPRPIINDVEEIRIEALEATALNATRISGTDEYWSDFSEANLTFFNLTLNGTPSGVTKDITFGLKDVAAGAGLTAAFNSNALNNEGENKQNSRIEIEVGDANKPANTTTPIDAVKLDMSFTFDGKDYLFENITSTDGTYAGLVEAINNAIDAEGLTTLVVEAGSAIRSITAQQTGLETPLAYTSGVEIIIRDPAGGAFSNFQSAAGAVLGQASSAVVSDIEAVAPSTSTTLIESNLVLDNAGRGSFAGDVQIGGFSGSPIDVEKINVVVDRDSKIDSLNNGINVPLLKVVDITSTGANGSLAIGDVGSVGFAQAMNFATGANSGVTAINANDFAGASLALGAVGATPFVAGMGNFDVQNVQQVNANIEGNVTLSADIDTINAGVKEADYTYTTGSGDDIVHVEYDGDAAASDNFSLTINTNAGKDNLVVRADGFGDASDFLNHVQLENLTINTGADNDTVALDSPAFGVFGTVANVDLGAGADTLYVADDGLNGHTVETPASDNKAQWFVNATNPAAGPLGNGNTEYQVFKTKVQVDFQGITSDLIEVEYSVSDYTTSSKAINEAIKKAIKDDAQLSKLLVANDLQNDGLQIDSLVDRALIATDLQINFIAPKLTSEVTAAGFNQSGHARYGNDTASEFADRLTVSDTELSNAWDAYFSTTQGFGNNLGSGTGIYSGLGASTGTVAGDAALVFDQMFEFVDGNAGTAGNMQTVGGGSGAITTPIYNSTQINGGLNSTINTINTITGGAGDDILVLSSREAGGFDTVVLTEDFGNDTIMNFNTGTSATPGTIADQVDFTAFLDPAAAARATSNTAANRVSQDVLYSFNNLATVPGGGLPPVAAAFDHNAVVSVNLSGLFANLAGATARPKSFDAITNAQVQAAMNAALTTYINTAGVTTASRMNGSEFVVRLVRDVQIELDGAGNATVGNTIGAPNVEQIYSGKLVWNATTSALEFGSITKQGTLEYGDMFSDLSKVGAESVTGTVQAVAEEAAANDALDNDTLVGNMANLVNVDQTATTAAGLLKVVAADGSTQNLIGMTVGNDVTLKTNTTDIAAHNATIFGNLDVSKVAGGNGTVAITDTRATGATTTITGTANYSVTGLIGDIVATNVSGDLNVTTADDFFVTVTTGSGKNTINGNAMTTGDLLTVTGAGDATVTVVDAFVTAATATGDVSITATGPTGSTLAGGAGDDTIVGGTGNDIITGGAGKNTLTGGIGADTFTISGDDTVTDLQTADTFTVTAGGKMTATNLTSYTGTNATNNSTDANNAILVAAAAGATIDMTAGAGANGFTLVSGAGVDTLTGSVGDDIFVVSNVADMLQDTIDGTPGGTNTLKFTTDGQTIADASFDGATTVTGIQTLELANGANTVTLDNTVSAGADAITTITGGTGVDTITLTGHGTAVTVNAGKGDDVIVASGSGDTINGGEGNDTITAGTGADTITGGAGNDIINLIAANNANGSIVSLDGIDSAADADTIYGFISTDDTLNLTNTSGAVSAAATGSQDISTIGNLLQTEVIIDTAANLGANAVSVGDQSAIFVDGGYAYESDTGKLYYDADGDFTNDVILVGTLYSTDAGGLDTAAAMAAGDFIFA